MKIFRTILFASFAFIFMSCSSLKTVRPVYLTNDKPISLLDLECVGVPIDYYQLMTGSFKGKQEFTSEVILQADEEKMVVIMITTTGQTIADITYDGNYIYFESAFIPSQTFKAEYIIADIQLAFYDVKEVERELHESGFDFVYGENEEGIYREIYDGNELIWRANKKGSHVSVNNYLREYNYEMENL